MLAALGWTGVSGDGSFSTEVGLRSKKLEIRDLELWYDGGGAKVLDGVSLTIWDRTITALIGPSGLGKSSLLRVLNRTIDYTEGAVVHGSVVLDGQDIFSMRPATLRRHIMLLNQSPMVFPRSIYDNVAFGLRYVQGMRGREELRTRVEDALQAVGLWRDVRDRLRKPAAILSGGQKALLCLARILVMRPDVILMDEPAGSLDPVLAAQLEALIRELRREYTLLIVTHNLDQAARVSDFTAYLEAGKTVEFAPTENLFIHPVDPRTQAYIRSQTASSPLPGRGELV